MNEMEYNIYVLMETSYKDKQKEKDILNTNEDDLFPKDWYLSKDYKLKTEILAEAIDKNILVKDTNKYKESIKGELN